MEDKKIYLDRQCKEMWPRLEKYKTSLVETENRIKALKEEIKMIPSFQLLQLHVPTQHHQKTIAAEF